MSYIQIEIGGKLRGLKFNQGALIIFQGRIDKENYEATTGYALIYAGLKLNAYVKGEEFLDYTEEEINGKPVKVGTPITFEKVCDWVDELNEQTVLSVINCFKETQAYKNLIPEAKEEGEEIKKKLETMEPIVTDLPVS